MTSANSPRTLLGGLTPAQFLSQHWQKSPLLIRGALPGFVSPLEPDDLAGLACEEGIEARLVEEHGPDKAWQVSHGPFDEETFSRLPVSGWSLLVQAVDHYVPEVAELLEAFDFIPRWRLDDIMVSYAPPGGSVGAHVDQYDVFLLQASGRRRWQLGGTPGNDARLIPGIDLRILEDFTVEADQDWVLEPGDMLYLPPGVAHHGISDADDCLTFSIGFRAPSGDEVVTSFADYIGEQLGDSQRYGDSDLQPPAAIGELDDQAIARVRALLLDAIDRPEQMAQWFGRAMTQPKYLDQLIPPESPSDPNDLRAALESGSELTHTLGSRFAWRRLDDARATLFADGDAIVCDLELAQYLSANPRLDAKVLEFPDSESLLAALVDSGSLSVPEEDDQ
ncbi:cupin domain-containing protein [Salinicola sp. LHM]|jgi:50S ribosomal protein L16 3-hydroxylase|uniref:ribosomal protein uL16 3-hydroxylase n=1 Tax=Salinicola sp. LHM TaxID=3065298 RepID=UPI002ACE2C1D|nr:cupin domain-containing protein [Salinicola sp. LHM]WQH31957.1 cupin domain-containing protein [Salinicola sp. LHM]